MEYSENSRENQAAEKLSAARRKKHRRRKTMRILRPVLIYGISIAVCFLVARVAINYALDEYVRPVDSSDATPITVTIEKGSGASTIAKLLYEAKGCVVNKISTQVNYKQKQNMLTAHCKICGRVM